jgi:mannose-6-phosphate isomerase-like protein (cupin superfamily)
MRIPPSLKFAAAALLLAAAASAAPVQSEPDGSIHASAAQLQAAVAKTVNGQINYALPTGPGGATVLIVRRDKTGDVEVHDKLCDILVAQTGHAAILIGGKITGNHEVAPGEWRGGKITGGTLHDFSPGDVIWIPAGLPHLILVKSPSFTYLAMKFAKRPDSAAQFSPK